MGANTEHRTSNRVKAEAGQAIERRMQKWFFEDQDRVTLLHKEAAEWIGTPFRKFSRAKGPGGGVDCVGLCEALMIAAGLIRENDFLFPRESADYQGHSPARKILKYLRGKEWRDEQSTKLARMFAEIELPPETGNLNPEIFLAGDIVVLQKEGQFHLPVILEGRRFINAVPWIGVSEGDMHDPTFSTHIAALFRARSKDSQHSTLN